MAVGCIDGTPRLSTPRGWAGIELHRMTARAVLARERSRCVSVRLMTPGPTALLEEARVAMSAPIIHHRTEEFRSIVRECREGLRAFFRTPDEVVILTSSGSGGMEAAIVNLLSPGDRVLVG